MTVEGYSEGKPKAENVLYCGDNLDILKIVRSTVSVERWIPACAGMTEREKHVARTRTVIPAQAGIHLHLFTFNHGQPLDQDSLVQLRVVGLDTPFKSNRNFNVLLKEQDGTRAASQFHAFEDTWIWNAEGTPLQ